MGPGGDDSDGGLGHGAGAGAEKGSLFSGCTIAAVDVGVRCGEGGSGWERSTGMARSIRSVATWAPCFQETGWLRAMAV
jgi:hypothetical protein